MIYRKTVLSILATVALVAVASVASGQDGVTYFGSLQFASGDYSLSETTNSLILFNGFTLERGSWTVSATLPVIHQDTPFVTYSGGVPNPSGRRQGMSPDDEVDDDPIGGQVGRGPGGNGIDELPDPDSLTFDENGVGDPVFRFEFTADERQNTGLTFGVYGAFKPPLADEESGFGTGGWDYGAGLTVTKRANSVFLLADLGYWIFGDLPDLNLKDPLLYSLGVGRSLKGGRYSVLASVFGNTETVDGVDGPLQASFSLNRILRSGRGLHVTLATGLTDSAPDVSLSAGWRIGL